MFTGIVEEVGKIVKITPDKETLNITIACSQIQEGLVLGASVSCNGICLTITAFDSRSITASAMPETIKKTTIKSWQIGKLINLERGMSAQSRFDGHIVQGHIDTVAQIKKIERGNKTGKIFISLPKRDSHLVVEQGSIAIDGVSLTVSSLTDSSLSVSIVEFTFDNTNLAKLRIGDLVNLEFDIIGKYVYRILKKQDRALTEDRLRELGF